jgi:hypothetical protein
MTGKKGEDVLWNRTSVAIRQDILKQALVSGLDINEICNQALAAATGIHYAPPQPEPAVPPSPVIIAKNGSAAKIPAATSPASPDGIHPVINADDPRAASAVMQVPRPVFPKIAKALPGRVSPPEKTMVPPPPVHEIPHQQKAKRPVQKKPAKAGKNATIKRFIAEATIRGDTEDEHVTKEILYQAFSKWCSEHRIAPVPDKRSFTVTLKNQFALAEKILNGEPAWINIRVR